MRWHEIFESTTTGATAAGNVAVVPGGDGSTGGIGAGFDPDGDWGVYNSSKPKKKKKSTDDGIIRRPR